MHCLLLHIQMFGVRRRAKLYKQWLDDIENDLRIINVKKWQGKKKKKKTPGEELWRKPKAQEGCRTENYDKMMMHI